MRTVWLASRLLSMVASMVFLVACDDSMSVHGRLLLPDGTPARGYQVVLGFRDLSLTGAPVITDDQGRYDVSHAAAEWRDLAHPAVQFFPPGAVSPAAILTHDLGEGAFAAPDVRLWDAAFSASTGSDGDTTLSWQVTPEVEGASFGVAAYHLVDNVEGRPPMHGDVLWLAQTSPLGFLLPARVLEDHRALVTVLAQRPLGEFTLGLATPDAVLAAGTLVSRARGASCTQGDEHGEQPLLDRDFGTTCPLTDGEARAAWLSDCAGTCEVRRHVTVDLGTAAPISSVILHGLSLSGWAYPVDVEVSTDGGTFTSVGASGTSESEAWVIVDLAQPIEARFVRLSSREGSSIDGVAELAVF
jgi:hypothetical protein